MTIACDRRKILQAALTGVGLSAAARLFAQTPSTVLTPTIEKPRGARKLEEKDMAGYVMVYFKDETHSAYFAISWDGYTFTDVNGGEPIFDGKLLAEQKGVRDPHIARGPDGAFYLAMTDLHIYGQRAGVRTTQWERPVEQYGWGNNRALVLMKSWDLIHWTHSDFRVDKAFPELGDIGTAWAPETIYDQQAGKMMVYFTIRLNQKTSLYYAYANDAFTKLETMPLPLAEVPGIDGDITKVGDRFHIYYVSQATVRHGISSKVNQGYVFDPQRIDPETVSTEAVFTASSGPAVNVSLIQTGNRFRLIVNEIDVIEPPQPLPELPVARAVWVPRPNLRTAAAAWIYAGGAHHTGFSQALTGEHLEDFAEMAGVEFLPIDASTDLRQFRNELRWNDTAYLLRGQ